MPVASAQAYVLSGGKFAPMPCADRPHLSDSDLALARVSKEERFLVHSAASGVGNLLVQLAKLRGVAKVFGATSRATKMDSVLAAGTDNALNCSEANCTNHVREWTHGRGADILFDAVGGAVRDAGLSVLAQLGRAFLYSASSGETTGVSAEQLMAMVMENQSTVGFGLFEYMAVHSDFLARAWKGLTGGSAIALVDRHRTQPGQVREGSYLLLRCPRIHQDCISDYGAMHKSTNRADFIESLASTRTMLGTGGVLRKSNRRSTRGDGSRTRAWRNR